MLRSALSLLLLAVPMAVLGQEGHELAARRAVIERDQQSASFALQVRQSQDRVGLVSGSGQRAELEALHVSQQHRQQALHGDQLRRFSEGSGTPGADRDRFAREGHVQSMQFDGERRWGPVLDDSGNGTPRRRWTPTLETERRWTPTLEKSR